MPERHRHKVSRLDPSAGFSQYKGSSSLPFSSVRRALQALPGRAPQVGEAELLSGVTQASAEPLTGAILFGPSQIASKTLDLSLDPPEVDDRDSRARGMGHELDGDSHPSSISTYPLRTNCNNEEPLLVSAPSPSGDTPTERPLVLANSGFDPTTNGFEALSVMEIDERQEGTKEYSTNSDTFNTPLNDLSVLNDNNVSHQTLSTDKSYKTNQNSSLSLHPVCIRQNNLWFIIYRTYIRHIFIRFQLEIPTSTGTSIES